MLSLRALHDLTHTQKEEGWTDEEKYRFAAKEIVTFERDELSMLQRRRQHMEDDEKQAELRKHDYTSVEYWDRRYSSLVMTYDWLVKYQSLRPTVEKYLSLRDAILVPGCGNSEFSFDLYDRGFTHTVSIDNSEVVIEQMQARQGNRPKMAFQVMDVHETDFADKLFDVVFDKSLFDCLLCGPVSSVRQYIAEMNRVLQTGGLFIVLSLHPTAALSKHMSATNWEEVEVTRVANPSFEAEPDEAEYYWVSVYRKHGDMEPDADYAKQAERDRQQKQAKQSSQRRRRQQLQQAGNATGDGPEEEDADGDEHKRGDAELDLQDDGDDSDDSDGDDGVDDNADTDPLSLESQDGSGRGAGALADFEEDPSSEEDIFEPQDRRTIKPNPTFVGAPGREIFESVDWIDLDDILRRAYPPPVGSTAAVAAVEAAAAATAKSSGSAAARPRAHATALLAKLPLTLKHARVASRSGTPLAPVCDEGHAMVISSCTTGSYARGWHCGRCGEGNLHGKGAARFHCTTCLEDVCLDCCALR